MGVAMLVGGVGMVVVVVDVDVDVLTSVVLLRMLLSLRLPVSLGLFEGLAVVAVGISGAHRCRSEKNVDVNLGWIVGI